MCEKGLIIQGSAVSPGLVGSVRTGKKMRKTENESVSWLHSDFETVWTTVVWHLEFWYNLT